MLTPARNLPSMPELGRAESYYAKMIHRADKDGNIHAHEAYKVGQYVTLALDPHLDWEKKLRYFQHALRRHCTPPPLAPEDVWKFYGDLANLVRDNCGREALRLACTEDDNYATRLGLGADRAVLEAEAEVFFSNLLGHQDACPQWFNEEDWRQLKMLRDQWI